MIGVIYMYTNNINNKVYIGQTNRPKIRQVEHKCHSLKRGTSTHFYNAVRKYGWDNFKYSILEEISANSLKDLQILLNEREIYWIKFYKSTDKTKGYNISNGGSSRGNNCKKIKMFLKDGTYIKTYDNYHEIINEFGGDVSSLYRMINNKNSLFRNKYVLIWENEEFNYKGGTKSKHIYYQLDLNNNLIKIWNSVCEIEKDLGYDSSSIIKCCNHPNLKKSYKGFKWFRTKTI